MKMRLISFIFLILLIFISVILVKTINAGTLSCSVTTAAGCTNTVIWQFRMSTILLLTVALLLISLIIVNPPRPKTLVFRRGFVLSMQNT